MLKLLGFIAVGCFLVTSGSSAHTVTLFGADQIKHIKPHDNIQYQVQLGAFKNKENAEKCRQEFAGRYQVPVQIIAPKEGHSIFYVMMGPFKELHAQKASVTTVTAKKDPVKSRLLDSNAPRLTIENRNFELKQELLKINKELASEEDETRRIALSRRKKEISLEMNQIMQTVIKRISV